MSPNITPGPEYNVGTLFPQTLNTNPIFTDIVLSARMLEFLATSFNEKPHPFLHWLREYQNIH